MFNWLMPGKLKRFNVAVSDVAEARRALDTMKLKFRSEGPQAAQVYAEGVRKVAALLSQRFELSVRDVMAGQGLSWGQFDDASEDLIAAAKRAGHRLFSETKAVRVAAQGYSFGCLLIHHLYRLRFLSERAPAHQRAAAGELAEQYAQFARSIAEISLGLEDIGHLYQAPSAAVVSKSFAAA